MSAPTRTVLSISWSVSRGRDTYGYNICRLDDQVTGKRYRCNGGGYDMVGTVLGEWLADVHQDRLLPLADQAHARYTQADGYQTDRDEHHVPRGLYGMTYLADENRVSIDGACGVESVLRIAKAAGLTLERTYVAHGPNRGNTTGWIVS